MKLILSLSHLWYNSGGKITFRGAKCPLCPLLEKSLGEPTNVFSQTTSMKVIRESYVLWTIPNIRYMVGAAQSQHTLDYTAIYSKNFIKTIFIALKGYITKTLVHVCSLKLGLLCQPFILFNAQLLVLFSIHLQCLTYGNNACKL